MLVVLKLDRSARGGTHLIKIMDHFLEKEIGFQSLTEEIGTTTPNRRHATAF
ncbi:recombinase family protein [Phaeobacter sp. 11ANDIMAR09]|uniref:recombinase family protein n=1 Tax=Phaeobacter sp. 11ANDIMAR09 TaxID=1225647 RepID=UPI0009F96528